jgi:hypothetical protein
MIYIDFYAGSHGHFLEFLINKYVYKDPQFENFLPFTDQGTSHNRVFDPNLTESTLQCQSTHYSYDDQQKLVGREKLILIKKIKPDDLIIRIVVEHDSLYYIIYNAHTRAGDISLDVHSLEVDTVAKLKSAKKFQPWLKFIDHNNDSPRSILRNMIYSQIREYGMFAQINNFYNFTSPSNVINLEISTFYDINLLSDFLVSVADRCSVTVDLTGLREIWEMFISKVESVYSRKKIDDIFEKIVNNISYDFGKLNIIEEAYLNVRITQTFDIHSGISVFSDNYPSNTKIIKDEICQSLAVRTDIPKNLWCC